MKNISRILGPIVFSVVLMTVFAFAASRAQAQSEETLTLDIKSQHVGSALVTLGKSAGVQIMLAEDIEEDVEVDELKGVYRFNEALALVLTDTGLTFVYVSENVVLVQRGEVEKAAKGDGQEEQQTDEPEGPLELAPQVVTGSRLGVVDPSARVVSITAEEISLRGVSSLEELFRTMPWAFPSITTQTNTNACSRGAPDTDAPMGEAGLGISTVNLRAMGSANTLVLVNGRRVAGAAGYYGDFANLLDIPISAIERVDIQLDGTSAVYGSEAIGGIVNVIQTKNYQGLSATVRHESSSTGADLRRASLRTGYAWGRGHATVTFSRTETKSIINAKTGWTSRDYRDRHGPEYELRGVSASQPALVCEFNRSYYRPRCFSFPLERNTLYQLPAGHDGVRATVGDFRVNDVTLSDHLAPRNGEEAVNSGYALALEQYLTNNLTAYANLLYSRRGSFQDQLTEFNEWLVPASNAYNPFGRHMVVFYRPSKEVESGLLPRESYSQLTRQRNYNVGFSWALGRHELEVNATRSRSDRDLDGIAYSYSRPFGDPSSDRFYAALESSDPNEAINVFGDGSAQSTVLADLPKTTEITRGVTVRTIYEPLLRGTLMEIWGGDISYAIGAEFRNDVYYNYEGESEITRESLRIGIERAERKSTSYFAEFAAPLVAEHNNRPGVRSLVLSLQIRRDTYESTGSTGRYVELVPDVPHHYYVPGEGWRMIYDWRRAVTGPLNHALDKHSATTPRIGMYYKPRDSVILRASWSRSFRPPLFSSVFSTSPSHEARFYVMDYAHPSGTPRAQREAPVTYRYRRHNLDLEPESSENYSLGIDWSPPALPGLRWTADWSLVDHTDRVEYSHNVIFGDASREVAFGLPELVERDASGLITHMNMMYMNIAGKRSEILDSELQYAFDSRWGGFLARLAYTRVLDESFQLAPGTPRIERVGTAWGSNGYTLRGSLTWSWDERIALDVFVQHIPGYENNVQTPHCRDPVGRSIFQAPAPLPSLQVESLTTVDATLTYRFRNGLRLRGGGRNLFKATAPTIWTDLPYDPTRWDARGQVFFLEVRWEM